MDLRQRAALFAVASSAILSAAKFLVGYLSGSMAVVSSGLDSLLDVFMSAMNLFAIRKADEPADRDHQYGHGKVEDMAGLVQSVIIAASGGFIIYKSVMGYVEQRPVVYALPDVVVMVAGLAASLIISATLNRVGEKTGSTALKADALHYTSDLYSNSGALLAMALTFFTGLTLFDFLFAVVIGLIIIGSAFAIVRKGFGGLLDESVPADVEREIEQIIGRLPYPYAGYHKLRTRGSGSSRHVDFHLLVCRRLALEEAHELASRAEKQLSERVSRLDVIIHVEPCAYTCDLSEENCTVLKMRLSKV